MSGILNAIHKKAKKNPKRIILPEGGDDRVAAAARRIRKKGLAELIVLNSAQEAEIDGIDRMAEEFYRLRKAKGMTQDEARCLMRENPVYLAGMMVRNGLADGFVAGAKFTTRDVVRAAIHCIGLDRRIGVLTSAFLMMFPDKSFGEGGVLLFADCAIIPEPDAKQLAMIAVGSAGLMKQLFDFTPLVAMLSYSTMGSGKGPMVEKVVEATKIAGEEAPDLVIEGELQADTALIREVAMRKYAGSKVSGKANVLIFPDLNSGNIGYKLSQRLTGAKALGPLIIGAKNPCSDLSRGCTEDEIVDIVAITSVLAGNKND